MRDIVLEETVYFNFTTRAITGVPTVLAGTPVLSVLEENNATPITAGVSVSVDRASVVGLNQATIVATAANGYEVGKGYAVYISTGTVNSVSAIGEVVAEFTIDASSATQDLANATDGLGALKTLIDTVNTDLSNGTDGLGALKTLIDAAQTDLDTLTAGCTLAAGAITNASLAGNMEIVFETDFATNYNTTRNAWVNNYTDIIGTMDAAAFGADFITEAKIADNALANEHFATNCLTSTEGDWNTVVPDAAGVAPTSAEINAEVDTALADINLDHFVGTASGIPALPAGTYLDLLQDDGTATYSRTTDSMQAIRDHIGDGTNLSEAGGTGDHLTAINLPNQTMDITGDITGNLSGSVGSVTGAVGSVAGNVDGSVASNVELGPAEVLTQVNAALDTAISELSQAAPTATPTIRTGLMLLYMALRNKTTVQTSGTDALEINNDAGTIIAKKLLTDDGSDYSEAEMVSGP